MAESAAPASSGVGAVVTGVVLWAVAMVYSFLRPGLWILDLILVPLMWLCWILGVVVMVAGAVRVVRRRGPTAGAITATAAAALVVLLVSGTVGMWWQVSSRTWFTTHRVLYQHALDTDPGDAYYGAALPIPLRFLTADGNVSAAPGGARFFPQWIGVPDDAGGYWFSPGRSPAGLDMYGMICRDPVDLGDDWWMCGMSD